MTIMVMSIGLRSLMQTFSASSVLMPSSLMSPSAFSITDTMFLMNTEAAVPAREVMIRQTETSISRPL